MADFSNLNAWLKKETLSSILAAKGGYTSVASKVTERITLSARETDVPVTFQSFVAGVTGSDNLKPYAALNAASGKLVAAEIAIATDIHKPQLADTANPDAVIENIQTAIKSAIEYRKDYEFLGKENLGVANQSITVGAAAVGNEVEFDGSYSASVLAAIAKAEETEGVEITDVIVVGSAAVLLGERSDYNSVPLVSRVGDEDYFLGTYRLHFVPKSVAPAGLKAAVVDRTKFREGVREDVTIEAGEHALVTPDGTVSATWQKNRIAFKGFARVGYFGAYLAPTEDADGFFGAATVVESPES